MATETYNYRGYQVALELFPKEDGTYAWAFTIGEGDAFGLERARLPTRDKAIADAMVAAEARIDSLLAK